MMHGLRIGLARGGIELRQTFTTFNDMFGYLITAALLLGTLFFMGDAKVPGTDFSLGAQTLPGTVGLLIAITGLITMAQYLLIDREDGTLLRAKATPNGMGAYLVGKIVLVAGVLAVSLAAVLGPGVFMVDGLRVDAGGWLTLLWLLPLAFLATMPIGAVLGAVLENPRNVGLVMMPIMGLTAISGIFYPITAIAGWLQAVAQVFPVYWLGLGLRSALLPEAMAAAELGGSWRLLETFGVLAAWAVLGLALAPGILRRMASRESGSVVADRRERAISRISV